MENIYWLWYKIAFGLEIIWVIVGLVTISSIRAKNLAKVGLFYNFSKWTFVEREKPTTLWTIWSIILYSFIISPFLSWISVLWRAYGYMNLLISKLSTPEKLKEVQYKLWATILTKEEVMELIEESANFLWKKVKFNEEDEEDDTLILNDDDSWYSEIRIDNNKVYFHSHPSDYLSDFHSVYEYKIEWYKVYRRCLEDRTLHAWKNEYYDVKDWVVLESDITERYNEDKSISALGWSLKEQINKFKKDCEWNEVTYFKTKYFILSKGTKTISKEEFKKHVRSDIERIKIWKLKVKELCDKYKVELKYNESMKFYVFRFINDEDWKTKGKEFEKKLETLLKQVKCERGEIEHNKEIIETLNWYLN